MKFEEEVNMRTIRLRLNEVMAQRGLTQTQLAELSGVRQAAISEMSRNIREQINIKTLVKIADALEINDISELLSLEYIPQGAEESTEPKKEDR
ncbi:helix-turn-helix domain-containing protein [Paenibacillus sp. DP01]|uniref:helix-turn-helix domain-containing protein n=1 Tax=Paenibacillus sp. DP01 TaxID=3373096 RepID=UPI00384C2D6F